MSLLSADELAAIQAVAESGLRDSVAIYRRTKAQTANGWVDAWPETPDETVLGWLYEQTSIGTDIGVNAGAMGLPEQLWLRVAIGTNLNSGDQVVVGGVRFTIEHTSSSDTYAPWLRCAVRTIA
jgi:hypothetical protein